MRRRPPILAMLCAALLMALPGAHATLVALMTFEETVQRSTHVVRGVVVAKEAGWLERAGGRRVPVTRYTLRVDTTYLGEDAPTTLTLTNPGGVQISPDQYAPMPEGFIDYPIGAEMAMMLSPTSAVTHAAVGLHQGIYHVRRDKSTGGIVLERAAGTATIVNQKAAPSEPLFAQRDFTEEEFAEAVDRAARPVGRALRADWKRTAGGQP